MPWSPRAPVVYGSTGVVCDQGHQFLDNTMDQNPCLVYAYMVGSCASGTDLLLSCRKCFLIGINLQYSSKWRLSINLLHTPRRPMTRVVAFSRPLNALAVVCRTT
ncbi:hypothetical protein CPB86DRAFT_61388 [Serendipita vermifera]|nr:hypothetical protein CPB86DRAFT_61388 [Serendipita vermifera]